MRNVTLPSFTPATHPLVEMLHPTRHELQARELTKLAEWKAVEAQQHRPWWMPRAPWRLGER